MKRLARSEPAAGEAARLGEELRDARMALGLSVEDLSAALRIRRVYLAALEEGRVRDLPAPAYAVGFVRSYARALGLDADDMVRRFRDSIGPGVTRKTDLVFPEPVPDRGVPAGAVMLVGAVLAVGAYVAWYNWSASGGRSVDAVPPPPPHIEQAAREAAPEPMAPAAPQAAAPLGPPAGGTSPARPPAGPVVVAPGAGVAAGPGAAPGGASSGPGFAPPAAPGVAPFPAPPPAAPPAAAPAPGTAPQPEEGRLVLRAKADCWLQVRDRQAGTVLVNRVLRPGETYVVPAREGLLMTTGNAGGLEILVDGQLTPGLGGTPSVRRDIPLDPERLRPGLPANAALAPAAPAAPRPAQQ
ncbi:DUF4115 domain-containing protein [Siccirubricoccus sp. KC 17139]|uniref:DUF4115 domain-containing protein n=1 Tax=Siccirubricoccus soli TaxID=2899147 RepID=A0ABT1DBA3_9PROT|nr:helix-turn-helix domain-containing protein [Siccirubricoccus soli]MCO6419206.1 DUF4115 domain-containing protein [Siccirubricoccus soli]MCP2685341.1 DUF4115 domain-containing protein [Siccirubricoccus soli]